MPVQSAGRSRQNLAGWWSWYVAISYAVSGIVLSAAGLFFSGQARHVIEDTGEVDRDAVPIFTLWLADETFLVALLGAPAVVASILLLTTARTRLLWHVLAMVTLLFGALLLIGGMVGLIAPLYQMGPEF